MWQKLYDPGNGVGHAKCIRARPDGGYIVAGTTPSGSGWENFWVLKLDADGQIPGCSAMVTTSAIGEDQEATPWDVTWWSPYATSADIYDISWVPEVTSGDTSLVCGVSPPVPPVIDKIRGVKEPGRVIRIIGSGFGEPQGDSEVHIGPKVYGPDHTKIRLWTGTMIKVKLLKYKCAWFKGNDFRRRKI